MTGPLLTTKFYMAPLRPGYIRRPRLVARLDEGLAPGKRLILVSAPAGYGKTSLVSDWLAAHGPALPHAWVLLDAGDNEPARLLAYLIGALRDLLPGAAYPDLRSAASLLLTGAEPPTPPLVDTLLNGLAAIRQTTVVVLDDYQVISAQAAHQVVRQLLDGLPPDLRVLITTRVDPPLGLAQLRVRDQLCELRLGDLHFTAPEATRFLNETTNLGLADADAAEIQARTEGRLAGSITAR